MSQENVEVVRRVYEIGRLVRDPGAVFDQCVSEGLLAANAEWRGGPRAGQGVAGVDNTVGRDEWVAAMRRILEDFEDPVSEVEDILDAGDDRVLAIVRSSGIGKRSGALVEMRMAQVYWLETGRIVRAVPFLDPNDALKAAGLRD